MVITCSCLTGPGGFNLCALALVALRYSPRSFASHLCDRSDHPGGMTMKKFAFILLTVLATLFNTALRADDYPTRPITLVALFGAGSAGDTICRIIANKLGPALGQPVIVEDPPGADGALAALYVHDQPADGYTLLMGTN